MTTKKEKNMKNSLLGLTLALPLLAVSGLTHAEDIKFVPRIEAGLQNYTYTYEKETPDSFSTDMLGVGITAIYGQLYLDVDLKQNYTSGAGGESFQEDMWDLQTTDEFDRRDFAITGGYSFGATSIFAGYKHGKTERTIEAEWDFNNPMMGDLKLNRSGDITSSGMFIGAAYSLMLGDSDALSFSIAYADLSVELGLSAATAMDVDVDLNAPSENYDYDGSGISISGKWSHYLESGKSVYLKFETQTYDYDAFVDEKPGKETETLSRLSIGVTF